MFQSARIRKISTVKRIAWLACLTHVDSKLIKLVYKEKAISNILKLLKKAVKFAIQLKENSPNIWREKDEKMS